jgi:pimeloyl-ACP methyl ester carboxylesterase/DNA-binding CsgD family transcriptional regulator
VQPKTLYADSAGAKIAYQVVGRGLDLVIVPGLVTHLELLWRMPAYRRFILSLSSFSRLVRFDKRGTGLSDPVVALPTLEERVADLGAVLRSARCRRPVLLGYSEGGPIAIRYAALHPRSVRALVLYGTASRSPPGWAMKQMRSMVVHWGEGRSVDIFAPSANSDAERNERAALERGAASPAMARALVEALAETDVTAELPKIRVPTLVVHRRTEFIPLSYGEALASGIRGARLVVLEGTDHLPWSGDSDAIVRAVGDFLREVAPVRDGAERQVKQPAQRPRRPLTGWDSLTASELRVAALAAQGLSNREIADRLFIARYTVETHLKHVFGKLGVVSRTELAGVVARNT